MSKAPRLNLSMFTDSQRNGLIDELDGAEIFITGSTIKAFGADGKEIPAHLDMIDSILRIENQPGYYIVSKEPEEPEPSAVINSAEIYAARRAP